MYFRIGEDIGQQCQCAHIIRGCYLYIIGNCTCDHLADLVFFSPRRAPRGWPARAPTAKLRAIDASQVLGLTISARRSPFTVQCVHRSPVTVHRSIRLHVRETLCCVNLFGSNRGG